MKITIEDVEHIAKLAKLKLTQEEAKEIASEFDVILEHFQKMGDGGQLEKEKTEGETFGKVPIKPPLRRDEAVAFEGREKLLQNVKELKDGFIQVPKIIEG